jgi:hypothetical protein
MVRSKYWGRDHKSITNGLYFLFLYHHRPTSTNWQYPKWFDIWRSLWRYNWIYVGKIMENVDSSLTESRLTKNAQQSVQLTVRGVGSSRVDSTKKSIFYS